ncbi:DUF1732 domain-containing protein [Bacillus sp. 1NLA3E]|uniref:DUF1732 domain-containing protein n=1 Tax=Bacillus sp. 1NLA3E TaxID=666686 RepID=UPI000247EC4E|nr:DUF1732 domain-containing protein [Bacillus sp. 1NLA3E]AGK55717.1 hypothetical protein B1NLA3E_19865 [Bacillus sp. 1NLA3E]
MDPKVKNKINSIIAQTQAIARELDDISQGLTREFKGIGAEKCASGLQKTAVKYRRVINELRKI